MAIDKRGHRVLNWRPQSIRFASKSVGGVAAVIQQM
jgi:hypothetical protein